MNTSIIFSFLFVYVSLVTGLMNKIEGDYSYEITYVDGSRKERDTVRGSFADSAGDMPRLLETNCEIGTVKIKSSSILNLPRNAFDSSKNETCERTFIEISVESFIKIEDGAFDNMDYLHQLVLIGGNGGTIGNFAGLNVLELVVVGFSYLNFSNVKKLDFLNVTETVYPWYVWDSNKAMEVTRLVVKTDELKPNHLQSVEFEGLLDLLLSSRTEGIPLKGLLTNIGQFSVNRRLHTIDLSECFEPNILEIDFAQFPTVKSIGLRNNGISNLETHKASFLNNAELRRVDLQNNMIQTIPPNYFNFAREISRLKLFGNPITQIHSNAFDKIGRILLSLGNNAEIDLSTLLPISEVESGHESNVIVTLQLIESARNVTLMDKFPSDQSFGGRKLKRLEISGNDIACPEIPQSLCKYAKRVWLSGIPCAENIYSDLLKTKAYSNEDFHLLCKYV